MSAIRVTGQIWTSGRCRAALSPVCPVFTTLVLCVPDEGQRRRHNADELSHCLAIRGQPTRQLVRVDSELDGEIEALKQKEIIGAYPGKAALGVELVATSPPVRCLALDVRCALMYDAYRSCSRAGR